MSAALPAFGTLVAWGEVLTMLGSPRTVLRDPARRALCAAFAGPAIGFTLAIPQVRAWLPLPLEHSPSCCSPCSRDAASASSPANRSRWLTGNTLRATPGCERGATY